MNSTSQTAREIAETILEGSGAALQSGDFEAFASYFALPHRVETFEGFRVIETRDEMRIIFAAVCAAHKQSGLTHLVRHCLEAEYTSENVVETTHETRWVNGDQLIKRPYPVFTVIHRIGGCWKIVTNQYAIMDATDIGRALHAEDAES